MPGRFDWFLQRSDDILIRHRELPALMDPSFQVLSQRFPGDGESVPVDELVFQQIMQDHCTRAGDEIGSAKRIRGTKVQERQKKRPETNAVRSRNQNSKKECSLREKGKGAAQTGAQKKKKNEPGIPPIL